MMSSNSFVFFIAKRISARGSDNLSGPVVRISVVSVALGVVFMLLSIAIVIGFQKSISDKVTGFTSHLQIVPFDNNAGERAIRGALIICKNRGGLQM